MRSIFNPLEPRLQAGSASKKGFNMKYVFEFGVRGGMHSDNTILPTQLLAREMASRMVMVLTNKPDNPATSLDAWQFTGDTTRIVWQSPTHFVAISKLDGTARGAASGKLWKKPHPGDADLSAFTYPEKPKTPSVAHFREIALNLLEQAHTQLAPHACKSRTVPSAPDTSKFQAMVSGMVEIHENFLVHGEFNATRFDRYLKIGSGVDHAFTKAVLDRFREDFQAKTGHPVTGDVSRVDGEDGSLFIQFTHGTSWGGVGIRVQAK